MRGRLRFTGERRATMRAVSTTFDVDRSSNSRLRRCSRPKRRRGRQSSRSPEWSESCVSWKYGLSSSTASSPVGSRSRRRAGGLYTDRGFPSVHAEAGISARDFYLRRGYRRTGPQTPGGAWPIVKEHLAWKQGGRRISAWPARRFWRSFKPFATLDFRRARGEFGARAAGLIGALRGDLFGRICWRTIRCTI
jgi:hypothetical protein